MVSESQPLTKVGKEKLDKELEHLIKVERENIKKAIAEARELGDLKENSEYHAAKERQAQIEGRIMEIQGVVGKATVVDVSKSTAQNIVFGATVTLYDPDKDDSNTFQIVGVDEAKEEGKISFSSPLGKALIGKEEGDTVLFKAPKGEIEYEVEKVEYL